MTVIKNKSTNWISWWVIAKIGQQIFNSIAISLLITMGLRWLIELNFAMLTPTRMQNALGTLVMIVSLICAFMAGYDVMKAIWDQQAKTMLSDVYVLWWHAIMWVLTIIMLMNISNYSYRQFQIGLTIGMVSFLIASAFSSWLHYLQGQIIKNTDLTPVTEIKTVTRIYRLTKYQIPMVIEQQSINGHDSYQKMHLNNAFPVTSQTPTWYWADNN